MNFVPFDQLAVIGAAIVDLGSALEIFDNDSRKFLFGEGGFGELRRFVNGVTANNRRDTIVSSWPRAVAIGLRYQAALGMLEHTIVHEKLVLDRVLLDARIRIRGFQQDTATLAAYTRIASHEPFALTDVPESVRQAATSSIRKNWKAFSRLHWEYGDEFYMHDKSIHDALGSDDNVYYQYCFKESNDSAERAWFYLTVSDAAQSPLVVSSQKLSYLEFLSVKLRKTMHSVLSKRLLKQDADSVADALSKEIAPHDVVLPPIHEMILVKALRENLSPLEASLALRQSPEAEAYRTRLRSLYRDLRGPANSRQNAEKTLKELDDLAKIWRLDPDERIRYRTWKLRIGKLPKAAAVAEYVEPEIEIDPLIELSTPKWLGMYLHSPDPCHLFISSWFRGADSKL